MKCREKLKMEKPEKVCKGYVGGCIGCPSDYGYLSNPDYCRNSCGLSEERCNKCWDREIPGTEDPKGTIYWEDGREECIDSYVKHSDTWIEFTAPSGVYLYKKCEGVINRFYQKVEMDEYIPAPIKNIGLWEDAGKLIIKVPKKPEKPINLNNEIDIHRLVDESIAKKDRYIIIFTSDLGTTVTVHPICDEDEDDDSN